MADNEIIRLKVIKAFLWLLCFGLFIWWPLSHWVAADLYHQLLGFSSGDYQDSLVKVIGTCGILPVILLFLAARKPIERKELIITQIFFSFAIAGTFAYLIMTGQFPALEWINVGVSALSGLILLIVFPWKFEKEME